MRAGVGAHGGREVDTAGDGFFVVFSSPKAALAAVVDIQRSIEVHEWPAGERVRVRMGLHAGEAVETETGLVGIDVHRAARIAGVAHGGQVLLSEAVVALTRASLPDGVVLSALGPHRLKDLGAPERLYQVSAPGLDSNFPPLRSLDDPDLKHNLPAQLASFIGRRRELAEVNALVDSSRLVTLTGAGGAGKTRLALQAAAEMLDGSGDGVWLVELAAISEPAAVPAAISEALGIPVQAGRPAIDSLTDALTARRILIILDNCEHLTGACAKTADTLLRRCPDVYLLATSREPLGINGETVYRVPSMSLPDAAGGGLGGGPGSDAVALFVERARARGAGWPAAEEPGDIIASICRRLDGMPLAIELAAARAGSMSLRDLLERLDQRFRLLTGGSRGALERQQTLRATVDWSYRLLNQIEQLLLRRLSIFVDSFDLAAAEAVCGFGAIDEFDVGGLLGSLVDKSLVVPEPSGGSVRYRLLETIRQYAAERFSEVADEESTAVACGHINHYLAFTQVSAPHLTGPDQVDWLARLDVEMPNIRRAIGLALADPARAESALRFIVSLTRYWMVRTLDDEMLGLLRPLVEQAHPGVPAVIVGRASYGLAIAGPNLGSPSRVLLTERAVELLRPVGDPRPLVESLAACATMRYFNGEPEMGLPLGQEAVSIARGVGDPQLLALGLFGMVICMHGGDPGKPVPVYDEAISCTERSGDILLRQILENNAGVAALNAGDLVAARGHFERSLALAVRIGSEDHHTAVNLAWVARQDGDRDGAWSFGMRALQLSRRDGDRSGLAYSCLALACLAGDDRDWERASTLHGLAQAFLDRSARVWETPEDQYAASSLSAVRSALGERHDRLFAETSGLDYHEALKRLPADPTSPVASALPSAAKPG